MRVLAVIVAHPLRKISGATSAGLQLTAAIARLADTDAVVMWDRDEIAVSGQFVTRYVRCYNRLGPLEALAPRFVRVPLYDSPIPQIIRDGGYDLVHLHNLVPALAAERIARTCRKLEIPYVISTHGFYELSNYSRINRFGPIKSALVDMVLTRPFQRIVASAAGIFTLSDCEEEMLLRLGVDQSRIDLVSNGVNEFYLEPPSVEDLERTRSTYGIRPDVPVLFFMGSIHPYKGVGIFLESLGGLRGPFQAVVGGGFKSDDEREALIRNAGIGTELRRSLVFTGAVSDEALRSLYHAANLFVYPTMGDSLPLVVMEAMACGLPVVSTTVGGLPYLVTPDCGTLVPPGDSAAVAAAVTAMLESPERMRTAGARGRARVATAFRWEHSARRAVAAYDKVLARKASVREAVFAD